MHHQPRIAAMAGRHPAARAAKQHRGKAATVDEHQTLLAARQPRLDGLQQRLGKALPGRETARVHQVDVGQRRTFRRPLGQLQHGIAAGTGVVPAFQGGRGGAQQHRHVRLAGAGHRHVPRRIAQAFLLFVGGVVLLVHDDERQTRQRREHRQARAQHDVGPARLGQQPVVGALHFRHGAMQRHQGFAGEAAADAAFQLRCQVDLRHQHQRLAALLQGRFHQTQVHLGFAATGDAVQQPYAETTAHGHHCLHRRRLGGREFRHGGRGRLADGGDVRQSLLFRHPALGEKALERLRRAGR
jgi:hypothetical protein